MNSFLQVLLSKKNLIIASVIFFVLRILFSLFFVVEFSSFEDYRIASNLVAGSGYCLVPEWGSTAIKSPGYPLFLSFFILLFGASAKIFIVIFQQIIFSVIPFLLIMLSNEWGKYRGLRDFWERIGFVSAWLFLFHPSYFYYPNVIEATNLFVPLFIIFLIFLLKSLNERNECIENNSKLKNITITGILSGLLFLTQPVVIPILIVIFLYLIIKKYYKYSIIYASIMISLLFPWAMRNYLEFDKVILTKSPFWMNLYNGWLPEFHHQKKYDIVPNETKDSIVSMLERGESDIAMEEIFKKEFIKYSSSNLTLYLEKTFYQIFCYWYMPPGYWNDSRLTFIYGRKLPVVILNILFVVGMYYLFRYDKKTAMIILVTLVYFTIVYGLTHSANIRFKLDIEWIEFIAVCFIFTGKLAKGVSK